MAIWIDAIAFRSGPLPSAAAHFTANQGVESDPPRGALGLRAITDALHRFAADGSAQDEPRFIEEAGAYLGLILIDYFEGEHQSRDGEHRVRVGRHGVVDPFAAVARALAAEDIRRALLAEVAHAEEEAMGRGPIARVAREVERQLAGSSQLAIVERFDRKLWVDSAGARIEIDLTRLIDVTRGESEAMLQSAVARICNALRPEQGTGVEAWENARERILPRVVGARFAAALPDGGKNSYLLQLTDGLWLTLVLKYRERARYVRRDEVDSWSEDGVSPRTQALHNLARASERARFLRHETEHGPLVIAQSRDGLDAARVLLPGLHELLARELGSPCAVALPHRDTLLAAPLGEPMLLRTLQERAQEAALRAPHAISSQVLILGEGGVLSSSTSHDTSASLLG